MATHLGASWNEVHYRDMYQQQQPIFHGHPEVFISTKLPNLVIVLSTPEVYKCGSALSTPKVSKHQSARSGTNCTKSQTNNKII